MIETMQDGYWETDLAGNFTFVNDEECKIAGTPREQLIGRNNQQYTDETTAKKLYEVFKGMHTTGEPVRNCEFEFIRRNGTKAFAEFSASPIKDAQGKPIGFRGVTRDVTERKRAEEALRQSEERYRTILETMHDGYWETDLTGTFTFVNDAQCRMTGSRRERLIGRNDRDYTTKEEAKRLYEIFSGVYRTGEPVSGFAFEYTKKDGTKAYNEVSVSLKRDAEGKPIGFRGISRDVTERKRAEEILRQSEEKYRTILESMQEGYTELDLKGNFTLVNDKVVKDLGYTKEELIGTNSRRYRDGKKEEEIYRRYNELYKTGETIRSLEIVYVSKNGIARTYELTASLIRDEQGKPIGFRAVSRDVTERKQAEEALRQGEEKYRNIIENIQDGYWEVDLTGNFTFVNEAECKITGTPQKQLVNSKIWQYLDETAAKKLYKDFQEIYRTGEPVKSYEFEFIGGDGIKRFGEFSASLIRDAQGKPIGFRGVTRDATERKKAENQLRRYATELERSNEEVKNFAYIVSHDLRVPLVNLKGYTSELRSALGVIGTNFDAALPHLIDEKRSEVAMALHEDVPEALEFITSSVSRMDSFINAVLILSRLGRQDLKPEPIDMNALVQTTLETMSHQIKEQGLEVIVGSLPQVVADRTAMERIVGNILNNAVKYLDSSRPCRIEVAAEVNNGETIFTIHDTGRGIAQEDMHKVFAPFRRAGKQDTQGEGMGLAYVQTLVRRHGGRIWCESELGKGTTFAFTISSAFKQGTSDA
jgi:PAS domain S-box-containing protein